MAEKSLAYVLLLIIFFAGILIRLWACDEPIWLDECHTAWAIDTSSPQVVMNRAAIGNQPPLYFLLVWLVAQISGMGVFSMRLVSLLAGSGLLIAASFWAWKLTRRWAAAVVVAGLVAFDGAFIFYASESRCYALIQLLSLLQAIVFWSLVSNKSSQSKAGTVVGWFAFSALTSALIYCHYTAPWVLIPEFMLVATIAIITKSMRRFYGFLASISLVVVSAIPLWQNIAMVIDRRSNWQTVSQLDLLWRDLEPWLVHWILIPLAIAVTVWLVKVSIAVPKHSPNPETKTELPKWMLPAWVLGWAMVGPVAIATAAWLQIAPLALVRYSAACWIAFALVAGISVMNARRSVSWALAVLILASSTYGNWWLMDSIEKMTPAKFRSEDWCEVIRQLQHRDPDQPIFLFADVIEDIDAYHRTDKEFQEYLRFPILGAAAIVDDVDRFSDPSRLIAMSTWEPRFTPVQLTQIRQQEGCALVFRGTFDDAKWIPGVLENALNEPIEFKFALDSDLPPEKLYLSNLHLIEIRLSR